MKNEIKLRSAPADHTPGKIRYFTYWLEWPDASQPWVDQIPFVHPLQWELKQSVFLKSPTAPSALALDLLSKGECQWEDKNHVVHRIVIEEKQRPRRWGTGIKRVSMANPGDLLTK